MIQEGADWMNDMLKFMHKHYTAWDVPLNTYLQDVFNGDKFPRTDSQKFDAISTVLNELQRAGLITYTLSEPPTRWGEGTPFSFETHNIGARLTFQGLTYVQGIIRTEKQDEIAAQNLTLVQLGLTQNKNMTRLTWAIAISTGIAAVYYFIEILKNFFRC